MYRRAPIAPLVRIALAASASGCSSAHAVRTREGMHTRYACSGRASDREEGGHLQRICDALLLPAEEELDQLERREAPRADGRGELQAQRVDEPRVGRDLCRRRSWSAEGEIMGTGGHGSAEGEIMGKSSSTSEWR